MDSERLLMNVVKTISLSMVSVLLLALAPVGATWAQVKVTAADPATTYQGTASLDVIVSGSGFNSSAKAKFLVSGTTETGGITVTKVVVQGSNRLIAPSTWPGARRCRNSTSK